MKVFEEVEFEVPTSDVQKKDFAIIIEMIVIVLVVISFIIIF